MKRSTRWKQISPSSTLLNVAADLAPARGALALDVACGYGRNAIALAAFGWNVVCTDRDAARLRHLDASKQRLLRGVETSTGAGTITTICAEMQASRWPFIPSVFHIIVSIHFVDPQLFPCFAESLCCGGLLYIETFGGQGENYRGLPQPDEFRRMLSREFNVMYYRERVASARHPEAVSVKASARRIRG